MSDKAKEEGIEKLLNKKEFDKYFKDLLVETEKQLQLYHNQYLKLLEFRQEYRADYKTHRIKHYLDKNGFLMFDKACKRQIGYQQGGK